MVTVRPQATSTFCFSWTSEWWKHGGGGNAWHGFTYVPSDGGGWIPYLTDRPVDFWDSSTALAYDDPDAVARWIAARKITHVYFGRRAGVLSRDDFASQARRYERVYDREGVVIFRVRF